jgi:hypothetical protein
MAKIAHIKLGDKTIASIPLDPVSSGSPVPDPIEGQDGYVLTVTDSSTQTAEWDGSIPKFLHYIFRDYNPSPESEAVNRIEDVLELLIHEYPHGDSSILNQIEHIVHYLTDLIDGFAIPDGDLDVKISYINEKISEFVVGFVPYEVS